MGWPGNDPGQCPTPVSPKPEPGGWLGS